MVSSYTTNKNLEKPGNGDYVDTWNVPVNADMDAIDQAFGGVTSFNATAGSAVLTDTQYRSLILLVSGAMSANVTYTIPSGVGGQWIVRNTTTDSSGGPWTVTFDSGGGGTSYVVPRGTSVTIFSDGTNVRLSAPEPFVSGTVMLFVQTSAPTGWTKSTTHDNKALRVVSGAAGSGGTTAFTSVFTSRTITVSNMPSHSHGVNDPGHNHILDYLVPSYGGDSDRGRESSLFSIDNTVQPYAASNTTGISIQSTGGGVPMDFAVQYVDVIIATKD